MQEETGWLAKIWVETQGYIVFIALAMWGGTVNYINSKHKDGGKFSWVELVGEWAISGFAGLLIALIGIEMGWSVYITCFMSGVAGHMGGRALFIFEALFRTRLSK